MSQRHIDGLINDTAYLVIPTNASAVDYNAQCVIRSLQQRHLEETSVMRFMTILLDRIREEEQREGGENKQA